MEIELLPYNLPDRDLINSGTPGAMVWRPQQTTLVLGQSNKPESSLNVDQVLKDEIPVMKRNSGGETVILTPETLVISVVFVTEGFENPSTYFRKINQNIMTVLQDLGVEGLEQKGISDISKGNKKILGSSIYRHRAALLYHAVLNISESPELMERYIAHPPKEPDYRKGRSHAEFVTSLRELGCNVDIEKLREALESGMMMM